MRILTESARLICPHPSGVVEIKPSQKMVTIDGDAVLVEPDPAGKPISGCLNSNPIIGIVLCSLTLPVTKGYSEWLRIDGKRVCLDTVTGFTVCQPPMSSEYSVADPGQKHISSDA